MNFDSKELQLIAFLCACRKVDIGIEGCEKEGVSDLYRKVYAMLSEFPDE